MSRAYQCDRCGEFYSGLPAVRYEIQTGVANIGLPERGDFDVCESCKVAVAESIDQALNPSEVDE